MKEPKKIPLDPSTPRAKDVKKYPIDKNHTSLADNDSLYTSLDLDKINQILDKIADEDTQNSN